MNTETVTAIYKAKTQAETSVLAHVDHCESMGITAGLGGHSKKRIQKAIHHLIYENHLLVQVHSPTKGGGWIRKTSLEKFIAKGYTQIEI